MKSSVVDSHKERLIFVGVMLTVIAFYSGTISFGFVWDDFDLIVDNPYLKNSFSPLQFFSSGLWDRSLTGFHNIYYRPITSLVTSLEYRLFGQFAGGYHLISLSFHLISLVLIWRIARKLNFDLFQSTLVIAIFSFHPVQAETIAYIASQGDLLAELFLLWSILCWVGPNRKTWASLILAFSAVLCKEVAILVPLIMIAWDTIVNRKSIKTLSIFIPCLIWIPYALLRILFMDHGHLAHMPWNEVLQTPGSYRILLFMTRLLCPFPTSSEWTVPTFTIFYRIWIHVAFVGLFTFTLVKLKSNRIAIFLLIWFLAIIFSVADWIGSGIRFSDQLLYVSVAPFCLLIANMIRNRLGKFIVCVILGALSCLSWFQLQYWRSDQVFWKNEIRYRPNDIRTQLNYGVMLLRIGNLDEGCPFLLKTNETIVKVGAPTVQTLQLVLNNLGICYLSKDLRVAEKFLRESLSVDPAFSLSRYNLVIALVMQNRKNEGLKEALRLTELRPDWFMSWTVLGDVQWSLERREDAKRSYERAYLLNSDNAQLQKYIHVKF